MELLQQIASLSSHFVVLNAEISEIDKDLARMDQLSDKYGDHWASARRKLVSIRKHKVKLSNDISFHMQLYTAHKGAAENLLKNLSKTQSAHIEPVDAPQIFSKSPILSAVPVQNIGRGGVNVSICGIVDPTRTPENRGR
ncbi:hypothetical protein J8273_8169 [Carpediemonas membranifera]|uniref:Uncharacterized protein n=1 Tax=Carpediemonas membranifera TaxID=201153 RepID=A0A8J6DZ97_9EUKA|nr:hypothetical protein J8273_8169 [Carpediemonas membranifera]|eukprot:KAG9390131.1 hypothetical protein J8273_8169 [Carpediemonas membranifera]